MKQESFIARVLEDNRVTIPKGTVYVLKIRKGSIVRIMIQKITKESTESFIARVLEDNRITIPKGIAYIQKLMKGSKIRIKIQKIKNK